jgi:hypothetical protein
MSDKLVAATNNAGSAENAHAGAHPYRLLSAPPATLRVAMRAGICYCIRASGENAARFDVCAAKHYAPASPAPRKAAGQTEPSWTPAFYRNSALSWETAA